MAQASSTSGRFYEADMKCQKVLYVKSLVVNASARTMDLIGCVNIHANFGIKHRNDISCIIMYNMNTIDMVGPKVSRVLLFKGG